MKTDSGSNPFEFAEQRSFTDGHSVLSERGVKRCEDIQVHRRISDCHHLKLGEQ